MARTRMLMKVPGNELYIWTAKLAERLDMQEVLVNPEDHSDYEVISSGESTESDRVSKVNAELMKENATLKVINEAMQKRIDELESQVVVNVEQSQEIEISDDEKYVREDVVKMLDNMKGEKGKLELEQYGRKLTPPYEADRRAGINALRDKILKHMEENNLFD